MSYARSSSRCWVWRKIKKLTLFRRTKAPLREYQHATGNAGGMLIPMPTVEDNGVARIRFPLPRG